MPVPFLDLAAGYRELQTEIDDAIAGVLSRGHYILGPEVAAFEDEWAAYCAADHCVTVANGLDALTLILKALGVAAGDEVLVPSNTFIATWLAVSQCGATPVPVEPDPRTHNIDPQRLEAAITPRTKAVIAVHLYGLPADLGPIADIARARGLYLVEDAAQAHGAAYRGRRIGGFGDAVAWSFYPGKNLGALGDGGAVTTDDADLAARLRRLRNYGSDIKYVHEMQGVNSRLDEIQAAVLRVKLRHLDTWNGRREAIARLYDAGLGGLPLVLPHRPNDAERVYHLYVVDTDRRQHLVDSLSAEGIASLIHYPTPPHRQAAYLADFGQASLPVAEALSSQVLSLPMGPHLSADMAEAVVAACRRALA